MILLLTASHPSPPRARLSLRTLASHRLFLGVPRGVEQFVSNPAQTRQQQHPNPPFQRCNSVLVFFSSMPPRYPHDSLSNYEGFPRPSLIFRSKRRPPLLFFYRVFLGLPSSSISWYRDFFFLLLKSEKHATFFLLLSSQPLFSFVMSSPPLFSNRRGPAIHFSFFFRVSIDKDLVV